MNWVYLHRRKKTITKILKIVQENKYQMLKNLNNHINP